MNKHTPGPWEIEPNAGKGAWISNDFGWAALALGNDHDNARANARLIAAAPDLLEALTALANGVDFNIKNGSCPLDLGVRLKKARAAIAKAEGNTPLARGFTPTARTNK
jgi:hypothetical protein